MRRRTVLSCVGVAGLLIAGSSAMADLTLGDPTPGTAGQMNTWTVSGADAGAPVAFFFGRQSGTFNIRVCPGVSLGLARPGVLGVTMANRDGNASVRQYVPRQLQGEDFLFQVFAPRSCAVSNVDEFTFN